MKTIILPLATGLSLVLVSCSSKQSSTQDERLKWNMATLVKAYDQVGHKSPKWDTNARQALTEFARVRAGMQDGLPARLTIIGGYAQDAVTAGCDDPMVLYLYCRFAPAHDSKPLAYWQEEFRKTAQTMESSGYPPLRVFYADDRAANVLWEDRNTNIWRDIVQFRQAAIRNLTAALYDKTLPIEEVADACDELLDTVSRNTRELGDAWNHLQVPLFKNWPDASVSWFVKGKFCYQFAWEARGGGYANQVSQDAWKAFFEKLAVADEAYRKAWSLNPHDVRIPTQMIEMCVSEEKKRPEMETWFERAMTLDTNNYDACANKLRYLMPQWYGSRQDMVEFGRECVASTNWGGRVPLILVDAHWDYSRLLRDAAERDRYWTQPDVWPDIKAAYDKFFQLNPTATGYRSYFARYALWCGQWKDFLEQISVLRNSDEGVDYDLFGGKDTFDKLVEFAKKQAGEN